MVETSLLAGTICVASTRVVHAKTWDLGGPPIPFSWGDALPARSPSPLMVHSPGRAPAITAAREFATAMPRSLWQCVDQTALSALGTRESSCWKSAPQSPGVL